MAQGKVHTIFDTAGRRAATSRGGGYAFQIRTYRSCTAYGAVSVGFDKQGHGKWKLDSTTAVW